MPEVEPTGHHGHEVAETTFDPLHRWRAYANNMQLDELPSAGNIYIVSIKNNPLIFRHNCCERRPIFKILSVTYSQENSENRAEH